MTITLHDVTKSVIEIIDKAGIYHFEYGDGHRMATKMEAIKDAHLSENYLYLNNNGTVAMIDTRTFSYLEMM